MRLLKNGGVYAQTPDVEGLALACESLLTDEALRERTGAAAKRISDSTFNWGREAAKYLDAYERLVPTPTPTPTPTIGSHRRLPEHQRDR